MTVTIRSGLALAILAVFTASASAQVDNSAHIRGRATDTSGAALPGVRMSVTGPGLIAPKATIADDNGRFAIAGLQPSPATYIVTAQLEGFETATVMVRAGSRGKSLSAHSTTVTPSPWSISSTPMSVSSVRLRVR